MTRQQAAVALADVLARENVALAALDFAAVGGWLAAKEAALAALGGAGGAAPALAQSRALQALALENRTLLERALLVQKRVLGVVARAAPRAWGGGYGRSGTSPPTRLPAVVLSARA